MFDLGELNGTSIAMLAVGLLKADGYYRAPFPGGALFLLIPDAPAARALNDISPFHVQTRITEALCRVSLDNIPAVGAYLSYKGYALNYRGRTLRAVSPEGEELVLEFDDSDRLIGMMSQSQQSQPSSWRERLWPWGRSRQARA